MVGSYPPTVWLLVAGEAEIAGLFSKSCIQVSVYPFEGGAIEAVRDNLAESDFSLVRQNLVNLVLVQVVDCFGFQNFSSALISSCMV